MMEQRLDYYGFETCYGDRGKREAYITALTASWCLLASL